MKGKKHIEQIAEEIGANASELKRMTVYFLGTKKNHLDSAQESAITGFARQYMSTPEAAAYLEVSRQRVHQLAEFYKITPEKFGDRVFYWKVSDLDCMFEMKSEK